MTWTPPRRGKYAVLTESSTKPPAIAGDAPFRRTKADCQAAAEVLTRRAQRTGRRRTTYTVVRIPDDVLDMLDLVDEDIHHAAALVRAAHARRRGVLDHWHRTLTDSF